MMNIVTNDLFIQSLITESLDTSKLENATDLRKKLEEQGLKDFVIQENTNGEFLILRVLKG